jgi:type VI protein secretion system component Hcp
MPFKSAKYIFGLLIALQVGPRCLAQNTIFAKFDNLNCQGIVVGHLDEAAVFSLSIGATNDAILSAGGAGSGKAQFADIKVVKTLDACTPQLFQKLAQGTPLNEVDIEIVNPATASAPETPVLLIQLLNVTVTSEEFAEAVGGRPSEVVGLFWQKITIIHQGSNATFKWDRSTNATF